MTGPSFRTSVPLCIFNIRTRDFRIKRNFTSQYGFRFRQLSSAIIRTPSIRT